MKNLALAVGGVLALMLGITFVNGQVGGRQGTEIRVGGGGGSGGAITGAYSFSAGLNVVNTTNVFLDPKISNILNIGVSKPIWVGANGIVTNVSSAPTILIAVDGDSQSISNAFGVTAGNEWPAQLRTFMPWTVMQYSNYAVAGQSLATMDANTPTRFDAVRPGNTNRAGPALGISFSFGGNNDIVGGSSAATIFASLSNICVKLSRANYRVVIGTVVADSNLTAPQKTVRLSLNNLIRSAPKSLYDHLIDIDSLLTNTASDSLNAAYDAGDGRHVNALGNLLIASNIAVNIGQYSPNAIGSHGGWIDGTLRITPPEFSNSGEPALEIINRAGNSSSVFGPNSLNSPNDNYWMPFTGGGLLRIGQNIGATLGSGAKVEINGGMFLNGGITNSGTTISSPGFRQSGVGTNALVMYGADGNLQTNKLGANLSMSADGTLSASATSTVTNFPQIRLDGEIYNITNAGNNTTVTADWNGPHWMRLQFSGTTTISFTNCPATQATNGQIYILELYAPTTVPTVTIQNIDPRGIDWGKVGTPQLVDGETNFLVVRFDGTNFVGRSWQDRTIGTITSPYVLQDNSSSSNHTHKGITSLTNAPADGSPELRIKATNGASYIALSVINDLIVTQKWVFNLTNETAGDVMKVQAVSHSGGLTTVTWTNGVDNGGGGSPGTPLNSVQFNSASAFAGDAGMIYDPSTDLLYLTNNSGAPGLIVSFAAGSRSVRVTPDGIHSIGAFSLCLGVNGQSNWFINLPGANGRSFVPTVNDSNSIGASTASISNLWLGRQIIRKELEVFGATSNLTTDFQISSRWYSKTNLVVDLFVEITNLVSEGQVFLIGQTNAATNHNIYVVAPTGHKITWESPTNGPFAFTLYSNSTARIKFDVEAGGSGETNITASWWSDSIWPQRNLAIVASAGGSTSNLWVGGMVYYDFTKYTNLNSTIGTFTNLATNIISGLMLTNVGDEVTFESKGRMKNSVTNLCRFTSVYGSETVFDSANVGSSNNVYRILTKITLVAPNSQLVDTHFESGPASGAPSAYTNWMVIASQTNSINTGFGHRGSSAAFMGFTNEYFSYRYDPASR